MALFSCLAVITASIFNKLYHF